MSTLRVAGDAIARSGSAPLTRGLVTISLFAVGPLMLLLAGFATLVYEASELFVTAGSSHESVPTLSNSSCSALFSLGASGPAG